MQARSPRMHACEGDLGIGSMQTSLHVMSVMPVLDRLKALWYMRCLSGSMPIFGNSPVTLMRPWHFVLAGIVPRQVQRLCGAGSIVQEQEAVYPKAMSRFVADGAYL